MLPDKPLHTAVNHQNLNADCLSQQPDKRPHLFHDETGILDLEGLGDKHEQTANVYPSSRELFADLPKDLVGQQSTVDPPSECQSSVVTGMRSVRQRRGKAV